MSQSIQPWLTTAQAQTELVEEVLAKHRGSTAGIKPTVKVVRAAAKQWRALASINSVSEPGHKAAKRLMRVLGFYQKPSSEIHKPVPDLAALRHGKCIILK